MIELTRDTALLAALHAEGGEKAWGRAEWSRLLENPTTLAWVERQADGPKGFVAVAAVGDEVEILMIVVVPSARRCGLGRTLLRTALSTAKRAYLEVEAANTPALALYQGEGFAIAGRRKDYYGAGRDALTLVWTAPIG